MRLTCFLVIFFFTLQSTTCSLPRDCNLKITNQSKDSITFIVSKDSVIDCSNLENAVIINDSIYINSWTKPLLFFGFQVNPKDSVSACTIGNNWDRFTKSMNNRIYIFFIEANKRRITNKKGVLLPCDLPFKRQSYTLEELKRNNWVITYPE